MKIITDVMFYVRSIDSSLYNFEISIQKEVFPSKMEENFKLLCDLI